MPEIKNKFITLKCKQELKDKLSLIAKSENKKMSKVLRDFINERFASEFTQEDLDNLKK